MALTIRAVDDGDVPVLVSLWHEAGVSRPWNDPERDIAFARREDHSTILVGHCDGVLCASAMVGDDGHRGWVYYLAVSPAYRRRGFATAMMDAVEGWLRARGTWKLQLLVRDGNEEALAFYQSLGFTRPAAICLQKPIERNGA